MEWLWPSSSSSSSSPSSSSWMSSESWWPSTPSDCHVDLLLVPLRVLSGRLFHVMDVMHQGHVADAPCSLPHLFALVFFTVLALRETLDVCRSSSDLRMHRLLSLALLTVTNVLQLWALLELSNGLMGGVVFGGKLFQPLAAQVAVGAETAAILMKNLEFGFSKMDEYEKGRLVTKQLKRLFKLFTTAAITFWPLATFGAPREEALTFTDNLPLLTLLPFITFVFVLFNSDTNITGFDALVGSKGLESNGRLHDDQNEKKETEDTADEEQEAETTSELNSKLDGLITASKSVWTKINSLLMKSLVHCKLGSFIEPTLMLASHLTLALAFYLLTDDTLACLLPLVNFVVPRITMNDTSTKISVQQSVLIDNFCLLIAAGVRYYLITNNVSQPF